MNLSMGIGLMLFSVGSIRWQATALSVKEKIESLSDPFRQSRVPKFILDTRHPWVIENKRKLERLPDAESFLCSGSMDVSENGLDVPPDLFEYLEIDNHRVGINYPGWPNALLRLREIQRCPAALSQVKTFKAAVWVSALDKEPQRPSREVLDLLADVLGKMTNLEFLKWDMSKSDASYVEEYFVERGLILPSVKRLEPGTVSPFIVRTVPNITTLVEGRYSRAPEELLRAAMFAPNLTRFAMSVMHGWDLSMVQDLVTSLPRIESLGLWGGLYKEYDDDSDTSTECEDDDPRTSLEKSALTKTLRLLQSLKNLKQLDLPRESELDVGWSGGPKCGRPFMGPHGKVNLRIMWWKSAKAVERAAALVVELLPHLTGFSIGETEADLTRDENGMLRASFPWTGRTRQWVMDIVPLGPHELDEGKRFMEAQEQEYGWTRQVPQDL